LFIPAKRGTGDGQFAAGATQPRQEDKPASIQVVEVRLTLERDELEAQGQKLRAEMEALVQRAKDLQRQIDADPSPPLLEHHG
jgi:hypothetical protein